MLNIGYLINNVHSFSNCFIFIQIQSFQFGQSSVIYHIKTIVIYIENRSLWIDLQLIFFTVIAVFSRDVALDWVQRCLRGLQVDDKVLSISRRNIDLEPFPPPGAEQVVTSRDV